MNYECNTAIHSSTKFTSSVTWQCNGLSTGFTTHDHAFILDCSFFMYGTLGKLFTHMVYHKAASVMVLRR